MIIAALFSPEFLLLKSEAMEKHTVTETVEWKRRTGKPAVFRRGLVFLTKSRTVLR